jgi:hypothetical protein
MAAIQIRHYGRWLEVIAGQCECVGSHCVKSGQPDTGFMLAALREYIRKDIQLVQDSIESQS